MIITEQHWKFKERANRLNSNRYSDLLPIQIDEKFNAATVFFMEHFAQVHKFPFEVTQQRVDMLSTLVVKYPEQPGLTPDSVTDDQYEFKLSDLKFPYAHMVRAYMVCDKNIIPVSFERHDNLSRTLNDSFRRPSTKWKRAIGTIAKDSDNSQSSSLFVNSDSVITELRIEYIREPKEVFFGGYNSVRYIDCTRRGLQNCNQFYNTNTEPVDSELPTFYHDLQVDIAVYLHTGKIENPELLAITKDKIISIT